nr:PIG-L family deacetylase [Myxococcota bacterium]
MTSRWRWARGCAALIAALAGCGTGAGSSAPPANTPSVVVPPLWVLAPHPDDESLMAAEIIASAVRARRPIFVHVMTNGDLGCGRDGWRRQDEAVAAMEVLGLPERQLRFLGYPDGWLDALGSEPLSPLPRTRRDGTCGEGAVTYGARGEGGADVHTRRAGSPGTYTAQGAIDDLVHLLERDRPSDVYVSHPIDDHPDHATTYVLLRRALE